MLKILLILLVSVQHLYALFCYSNGTFYFSRDTFHWNNFSSILLNINKQTLSTNLFCHVRIIVDYDNDSDNYVTIQFGLPINYTNPHIEFGSTLNFYKNDVESVVSYLDYSCLSGNFCDKIFLNNWAKNLLYSKDNPFHTSFISLWNSTSNTPNECNAKKVTKSCLSYLCFIIYDELKNLSYGKSQCKDTSSTKPVHINVKTHGENSIHYQCIKNHCTEEAMFHSVSEKNFTDQLTDFEMEKNLRELHEVIFLRTVAIVGSLLFIGCVAYYILCQQNKQGYRLAATN